MRLTLLFLLMVTLWSLAFIFVKIVTRDVPPLMAATIRVSGSALLMIPIATLSHRRERLPSWHWPDAPRLVGAAIAGVTLNQSLFVLAVNKTSVAHSAIVFALMPVVVHVLSIALGKEQSSLLKFVGMAVAIGGVVMLQVTRDASGTATLFGDMCALAAATAFSVYTVLNKQLTPKYGSVYINAMCFAIGAVTLLPVLYLSGQRADLLHLRPLVWIGLLYMAGIQGVTGYLIYYYLLSHMPATRVAMYTYLQPIFATVFAWALLGERVGLSLAGAAALVFAGVWLSERRG